MTYSGVNTHTDISMGLSKHRSETKGIKNCTCGLFASTEKERRGKRYFISVERSVAPIVSVVSPIV